MPSTAAPTLISETPDLFVTIGAGAAAVEVCAPHLMQKADGGASGVPQFLQKPGMMAPSKMTFTPIAEWMERLAHYFGGPSNLAKPCSSSLRSPWPNALLAGTRIKALGSVRIGVAASPLWK